MFPCPRSHLRTRSRETGSAVPSRVSLLISILRLNLVLTYRIPPEFRDGVHLFILTAIRHRVSPEFIGSRNCDYLLLVIGQSIGLVCYTVLSHVPESFNGLALLTNQRYVVIWSTVPGDMEAMPGEGIHTAASTRNSAEFYRRAVILTLTSRCRQPLGEVGVLLLLQFSLSIYRFPYRRKTIDQQRECKEEQDNDPPKRLAAPRSKRKKDRTAVKFDTIP